MSKESIYVGSGAEIRAFADSYSLEIDLDQFRAALQGEAKKYIRKWTNKKGQVHSTIRLDMFPLKPENVSQFKTHSIKISTYEPKQKDNPASITNPKPEPSDFPF